MPNEIEVMLEATEETFELLRRCPLFEICTEGEEARAEEVVAALKEKEFLTFEEDVYLESLEGLLWDFREDPLKSLKSFDWTPAETLECLMDLNVMSVAEVAESIGTSTATVYGILSGRSLPSRKSIFRLSALFGVPPINFLQMSVWKTTPPPLEEGDDDEGSN